MSKVFEDEFMEIQSDMIGLCMELLDVIERTADKVFAYGSNEKSDKSFNAFFEINGEIKTLGKLKMPPDMVDEFLRLGIEDIQRLDPLSKQYDRPVPTELRLYYDVQTGKFSADYKYEEVCTGETGVLSSDVFMDWVEEEKRKRGAGCKSWRDIFQR